MNLTRRQVLTASAGLLLPRLAWAQSGDAPRLCWMLVDAGDTAREAETGMMDAITSRTGHAIWVGKGSNRALRLDGYSVWVQHGPAQLPLSGSEITICAWLALESYPVETAAIAEITKQDSVAGEGIRLTVDKWGYLEFHARAGEATLSCRSSVPLPRAVWTHVSASFGNGRITIYRDGMPYQSCKSLRSELPQISTGQVTLGHSTNCPTIAGIFPTGTLNGLIKDVRIFNRQLSISEIEIQSQEARPDAPPDLEINGAWCAADQQRPIYHALPPRAWTNEPHGLIHWGGQYHLFYQKNANGPYWGHINWGHMASPDLYTWTEMPVALSPEPGPDSEGCWSGSVIDHDGKLALIYTGGDGHRSTICLATSSDGIHFTKHPGNPIIAEPPQSLGYRDFRDPYVWREIDTYYLIIGSAVRDLGGTALLYRSRDLLNWEFRKRLLVGDRETSGVFWEMPVFVRLGDFHALIVCEVPGRASYWVGTWKDETFTPITVAPRRLELFNHFLSPTPLHKDAQMIVMGIIPDERHPKECWAAGWAHHYSLPRVLSADASGHLYQHPYEGIDAWSAPMASLSNVVLEEGKITPLRGMSGTSLRLQIKLIRGSSESVSLLLRRSPDGREKTEIRYQWEVGRLVLDRTESSLNSNVKRDMQETTYFPKSKDVITLTAFLDQSAVEVFVDERAAFATRIYPTLNSSDGVALSCSGAGAIAEQVLAAQIDHKLWHRTSS